MCGVDTCLSELSYLTGTMVRETRDRTQWRFPVALTRLAHVINEGVQQRVRRFSEHHGKKKENKPKHYSEVITILMVALFFGRLNLFTKLDQLRKKIVN